MKERDRLNPLPIDIEMIVEQDLGLDIIPVPNLRAVIETEAFLSSDLKAISVDESLLKSDAYVRRTDSPLRTKSVIMCCTPLHRQVRDRYYKN